MVVVIAERSRNSAGRSAWKETRPRLTNPQGLVDIWRCPFGFRSSQARGKSLAGGACEDNNHRFTRRGHGHRNRHYSLLVSWPPQSWPMVIVAAAIVADNVKMPEPLQSSPVPQSSPLMSKSSKVVSRSCRRRCRKRRRLGLGCPITLWESPPPCRG